MKHGITLDKVTQGQLLVDAKLHRGFLDHPAVLKGSFQHNDGEIWIPELDECVGDTEDGFNVHQVVSCPFREYFLS
jgi:hypothetical protein